MEPVKVQGQSRATDHNLAEPAEAPDRSFALRVFSVSSPLAQTAEVQAKSFPTRVPIVMVMVGFLKTKNFLSIFLQVWTMAPD